MIGQFALRLIWGMALSWCLAPREEITSGFFRVQMLVTLALSVLAAMVFAGDGTEENLTWTPGFSMSILTGLMGLLAFVDSVLWTLERRTGATRGIWLLLGLAFLGVLGSSPRTGSPIAATDVQRILSNFASGWAVGGVTTAMLLGHWYLTATGMKLLPLIRLNQWAAGAVLVRAVLAAVGLFGVGVSQLGPTDWVWLSLRWAGLIGPAVMSILVIRILKYRNTQSATGVLYASTILVFMGETASLLLAGSEEFHWSL